MGGGSRSQKGRLQPGTSAKRTMAFVDSGEPHGVSLAGKGNSFDADAAVHWLAQSAALFPGFRARHGTTRPLAIESCEVPSSMARTGCFHRTRTRSITFVAPDGRLVFSDLSGIVATRTKYNLASEAHHARVKGRKRETVRASDAGRAGMDRSLAAGRADNGSWDVASMLHLPTILAARYRPATADEAHSRSFGLLKAPRNPTATAWEQRGGTLD